MRTPIIFWIALVLLLGGCAQSNLGQAHSAVGGCQLPTQDPVVIIPEYEIGNTAPGDFTTLKDIRVDPNGNIIGTDGTTTAIIVLDAETGEYTRHIDAPLPRTSSEYISTSIYNRIYIAEPGRSRVNVYDNNYNYIFFFGIDGTENGQFKRVRGIATSPNSEIYVADSTRDDIQIFSQTGVYQRTFISNLPQIGYLYMDRLRSELYIVEESSETILRYSVTNNTLQATYGSTGPSFAGKPRSVWVDSHAYLHVADDGAGVIRVYGRNTDYLHSYSIQGASSALTAITFDPGGNRILISDANRHTIFALDATDVDEAIWCEAMPCTDLDGDGYGTGDTASCTYTQEDCDDMVASCNLNCQINWDGDTIPDCRDSCMDGDQDGYGGGSMFNVPRTCPEDCDQNNPNCNADCGSYDVDTLFTLPDCIDPCIDYDGDGYGTGTINPSGFPNCLGPDCNNNNSAIKPGVAEVCGNGVDDNCDGLIDSADPICPPCVNPDGDRFGVGVLTGCPNSSAQDCNNANNKTFPGALDYCGDSIDSDCNGLDPACPYNCITDNDLDGFFGNEGCASNVRDCNDTNPQVRPNIIETCGDGIDNNCDGLTDSQDTVRCPACITDTDNDGFFSDPICPPQVYDCDDFNAAIKPGVAEICTNFVDDNCDGSVDTQNRTVCPTCSTDNDFDGYKSDAVCSAQARDCDDTNARIHPGATDVCDNNLDENCAGGDARCPPSCDVDEDLDGYLVGSTCTNPDCDDENANIYPGTSEQCGNLYDDNCDGEINENCGTCTGPDCLWCRGLNCPTCRGTDCNVCIGSDCPGCDTISCSTCEGIGCPYCEPDWQCTLWGSCISNREVRSCFDANNCQSFTDRPEIERLCGDVNPDDPTVADQERTTILEFPYDIYRGIFTYRGIQSVYASLSPSTSPPPDDKLIYQMFELTGSHDPPILKAQLFFRIENEWLASNDVAPEDMELQVYQDSWIALPTTYFDLSVDSSCPGPLCTVGQALLQITTPRYSFYQAPSTPGLGVYAIASKLAIPQTEDPTTEEDPITTEIPPESNSGNRAKILFGLFGLFGLVGLGLWGGSYLKHHHEIRHVGEVPNTHLLQLTDWIGRCRRAGYSDEEIRRRLRKTGWSEEVLHHYL